MVNLSRGAQDLVKTLFKGEEKERMISAGVVRTILADMIKLYFEHKTAVGKGVLVFNPVQPELSNYLTVKDLENDLAVAQESMNRELEELFELIIKVIQKEDDNELALIAMIQDSEVAVHLIDPVEANKNIDELSNGIIF
jgi:hypothetical protein